MTEQDAEVYVRMRTSRGVWLPHFLTGCLWLAVGAGDLVSHRPFALFWLALGSVSVALGSFRRNFGVDLTPESATVRRVLRRKVAWQEVQAVIHTRSRGRVSVVQLVLETGKPLTLPAPRTGWRRSGAVEFERDYNRIGHWWLAHRGVAWRPVRPEAPQLPE